jgi:hypothetical protein
MGVNALVLIHSDGLAAYRSTGRRSFRIFLTRIQEFVVERAMHLLVLFIGAPLILAAERREGLLTRILVVIVVAGIAVRIPSFMRWLISRNPQAREWLDGLSKRRRERIEARDAAEARALLDRAMRDPVSLVIPWTGLTEARFTLETGFRQIMVYGPPSAYWSLAWESWDGRPGSAQISVPVRSLGYPALGFADLRLAAELRRVGPAAVKDEGPLFAAVPGLKEWMDQNAVSPAAKPAVGPVPGRRPGL